MRSAFAFTVISLILAFVINCRTQDNDRCVIASSDILDGYVIHGKVTNLDGELMQDIKICMLNDDLTGSSTMHTQTDSKGEYSFALSNKGKCRLWVEQPPYVPSLKVVNIGDKGSIYSIDFSLEKGQTFIGRVIDIETNLPIKNATITYQSSISVPFWIRTMRANNTGHFIIEGIEKGVQSYTFRADGYAPEMVYLCEHEYNRNNVIALASEAVVSGIVIDESSNLPLKDVDISIDVPLEHTNQGAWTGYISGGRKVYIGTKSNDQGVFSLTGIKDGAYILSLNIDSRVVKGPEILIENHKGIKDLLIKVSKDSGEVFPKKILK